MGISESTRSEQDALVDNGQHTRLKGQKGAGPSLVSVESADEGSGVSSIQHTAVQRSFERQVESFVEHEDVPDDVKRGVRTYFEQIHRAEVDGEPQTTTPSDSS